MMGGGWGIFSTKSFNWERRDGGRTSESRKESRKE